ncbi:TonB-dependent receptor plug domain-containing protein [Chitinophaga tropicalis]|nr:TonB-dependent receptor plug domain-containing protein [Chitinophaga tropicalis]
MLLLCLFTVKSFAQLYNYNDNKEKIYIHTNHVFFKPGEDMFFKVYLVNAKDQTPTTVSRIVYVEILNPSGNVLKKLSYRVEDGYAEGSFEFGKDFNGGIYKLRAYTAWMQNETQGTWFTKEITLQKTIAPRILMKLDFPRKGYGPGDEVTATYSMRNLEDHPITNHVADYTVSIGGIKVQSGTFKTDANGKAEIRFKLPAALNTNDGLLNVTVKYELYTEAISRSIPISLDKVDLQFMPEGGAFVEGLVTNVAFKAINEFGKPVDARGIITDPAGKTVASFESYHNGMGQFSFTPQPNIRYTAKITSPAGIGQAYEFPVAVKNGVVMNATRKDSLLLFRIAATKAIRITLTGESRNKVYYRKEMQLKKGEQFIEVDPVDFPSGIARFTITDEYRTPLAERIAFLHHNRILQVKITADKEKYLPREKVSLRLKTLDEKGNPIPSNFSMAVIDDKLWSLADDKQDHILSWLLMSSELQGKIEEPQFYFKKEEKNAVPALDLVMLTHGYRYFDYIEAVEKAKEPAYNPDLNNILSGVVQDKKGKPVKAVVYLIETDRAKVLNNTPATVIKQQTNEDGIFFFTDITPETSYQLVARSEQRREKVNIKVLQHGTGYTPLPVKNNTSPFDDDRLPPPLITKKKMDKILDDKPVGDLAKVQQLNESVIIAYGVTTRSTATGCIVTIREDAIVAQSPLTALQGKAAGISISGVAGATRSDPQIRIRGSGSLAGTQQPLIIVDGIPFEKLGDIQPDDIESVTVFKNSEATALYGSRAANGVIVITSKSMRYKRFHVNLSRTYYYSTKEISAKNNSYDVARRFYAPLYHSPETKQRDDFRETIYWNPVIQTDANGDATVEFYNSDATTTFRAIAEGLGYEGTPGRTEFTYAVQGVMSVDAKIPPYLTVGDNAQLPLVITNNGKTDLSATVGVSVPPQIVTGNFENKIEVPANSSRQMLIPVTVTSALKGNIRFTVSSAYNTETISLPVEAAEKGFPVITTISGNKETDLSFNIGAIVPGSLQSELKTFASVEGQLLDGIASMLREPHGCFEQTSSSTYPNILILKYLKESGRINPEIEAKALDYIEKGYQRLIGFETPVNGFEWFGHTPPHEALTAYGLLEFTDMQPFIKVDQKMMDRTRSFLLSRKDGKGGFKTSGGHYNFYSVPSDVANTYIVYALTQAGIKEEIDLEYKTAVQRALETRDAYRLAMTALSASNMGNEKDYAALMDVLNTPGLTSQTSMVNGRAESLQIETQALYVLALAREKTPRLSLMAEILTKIMEKKSYFGYGSTQATVLALQAIVEYYKAAGAKAAQSSMEMKLNGSKAITGKNVNTGLKEGANTFSVRYATNNETMPYNLEISYFTLLPPNSPEAELQMATRLSTNKAKVGETVRMDIEVKNVKAALQPMAIAKIGIPAGLTAQSWQLKEIMEKSQVAFYETFDNYLVLYWMGFGREETKKISLDLKAEIPGTYKGKAGNTYLYYTPEFKHWSAGTEITVMP